MNPLQTSTWQNQAPSFWLLRFSFIWLVSQKCCTASAVWTAYMNISFHVGNRMLSELGETGVFGRSSILKRVAGVVVPPEGKIQNACDPNTTFILPRNKEPWIALIERGGCAFTQKIKVASEHGARGVIIYNFPGTGNQVFPMSHQAFEDIVVVMIGNIKGMEILHLIRKGVHVTVMVEVGRKHVIWLNHYFVSFMIVTTATLAYFTFYHIRRLWVARIENRRWKRLTRELKKAFGQLQVRVLKEGDEEVNPNADSCVICFEAYKPNEIVRILTCKHFFHKNCIDPWILAHGTCPMCKCDILKALGIQMDIEDGTDSLQVLMSNELPGTLSPVEEETNYELPPARTSSKVTHVQEHPTSSANAGSQPPEAEETSHPSHGQQVL
jgi:E3 ubiquitin-protein ligase RNF133|uniref:E3 ubiquitin-protein ligase RNF133 n=1 Tax=Mus musculus TaxID=10090 RepID=RN133_MOUSE|nr:RecName: Full=E3 ubiquitin-protein ligase RNF133; AltName: Full=Goliath-related E3 ubiquitin-protein ligase 2; AltName: Full=RING finger protein 133; AltName: Full=RING-type E3 ubiquitin transferase RNF133 [Mus musculus]AAI16424.1 Rnf133 protein [Mus musculus]AAI16425.1 Rnf133 protein [Mus musculus]